MRSLFFVAGLASLTGLGATPARADITISVGIFHSALRTPDDVRTAWQFAPSFDMPSDGWFHATLLSPNGSITVVQEPGATMFGDSLFPSYDDLHAEVTAGTWSYVIEHEPRGTEWDSPPPKSSTYELTFDFGALTAADMLAADLSIEPEQTTGPRPTFAWSFAGAQPFDHHAWVTHDQAVVADSGSLAANVGSWTPATELDPGLQMVETEHRIDRPFGVEALLVEGDGLGAIASGLGGEQYRTVTQFTVVPEPASVLAMVTPGLVLGRRRR